MKEILEKIRLELRSDSDLKTKKSGERFFKEEIKLYGVKAATVGEIAKKFFKDIKNKNKEEIWSSCKFLGKKTNNQSEYSALILGLKGAIELKITRLTVLGDSLLVITQVNGLFKVRSEMISELYEEVCLLKSQFEFIEFHHVYREYNKRADELSNLALQDLQNEKTCFEIHELDEDWIEEIKLDELPSNKKSLFVKIPSAIKSKNKQLSITEFFKVNSLFPNIS